VTVQTRRFGRLFCVVLISGLFALTFGRGDQKVAVPPGGEPVIALDAYLTNPVGGLERTNGDSSIVSVEGKSFTRALHVTTRLKAAESNASQMTVPNARPVAKGDVMLASVWLRGAAAGGQSPAIIEVLFERMVSPWTKSVSQGVSSAKSSGVWKHAFIPFQSSENYGVGEAMVSVRFATQPQSVEIGELIVVDYGKTKTLDQLVDFTIDHETLGTVAAKVDMAAVHQTMMGFGGDFCQPRYGSVEAMDVVGQYALDHLHVIHARVGFPLNNWNPQPGEFRDDAQAHAALLLLQIMARRHIPIVLTIWEGPQWMIGGAPEQMGKVLDPAKYAVCADAIVRFLTTARDKYGAVVDNFSFNEADYGVNFKFTSKTIGDFIRVAGPLFRAAGLKTKFVVGDTGGGSGFHDYAVPLLQDPTIAPFLGPLAFHCWDGLGATEASYRAIAAVGKTYKKPIWCLEAGHDAGLWQAPDPWGTWENALRTAMVYERTLRLTDASLMDYWTYEDNYPLVDKAGPKPYPVFRIIKQMEDVFKPGSHIVTTNVGDDALQVMVTSGPVRGRFAGLIVNAKGSGAVVLSGLPANAQVQLSLSDKSAQEQNLGVHRVSAKGTLKVTVPARSVITLIGTSQGTEKR